MGKRSLRKTLIIKSVTVRKCNAKMIAKIKKSAFANIKIFRHIL